MKHDPKYQEYWIELLNEFSNDDLPIGKFCEKHGVKDHQFYYWRNKINGKTKSNKSSFVKLNPINEEKKSTIKLETDGVTLHIENDFDAALLKSLLTVVKQID